jgi:hypothetical protein
MKKISGAHLWSSNPPCEQNIVRSLRVEEPLQFLGYSLVSMRIQIQLFFNADPDPDPVSQTNAGLCRSGIQILVRLISHKKMNFYMKNILTVGKIGQTHGIRRYKSLFERQETRFIF